MTVEQRTEEANWFRKIGTHLSPLACYRSTILQRLHFSLRVSACVCPRYSVELGSAVQEPSGQDEGFIYALLPGKCPY